VVNSRILKSEVQRDNVRSRTPMRCPICGGELARVHIRDMGGLTAGITWMLHAGECPEHGWFQAEFSADPPREIFPVNRPFGAARRVVVDGREFFEFRTRWGRAQIENRHFQVTDPLDPAQWETDLVQPA
jgi:hypothetical protein